MKADKDKPKTLSTNLFPVVGIGASAGGLDAFKRLLKAIPENSGMAYVLVQHLDPSHESLLPELLQKVTPIPVLEISDDIKVLPDHIYIIPSNKMLVANDGILQLSPRPPKSKNERNLPIDLFFTSLAEVHQTHAIGVVLSGTASDGTKGLQAIKDHGGITFAQDEFSAAYEAMPNSAIRAGVVDFILPPEDMPKKLLDIKSQIVRSDDELQNLPEQDEDVFRQILSLLRIRKATDFTYYKQTTIRRRILRRMAINKIEIPAEYLNHLRENRAEQDALFQDLLIPVTSFFRDPKIFEILSELVLPQIAKNKAEGRPIRVWVAGCSTGEEAYSIAICLKSLLGNGHGKAQVFATDLSEPAIAKARTGIYSKNDIEGVPSYHLDDYFTKINGDYQVNKQIRDMCVFAVHNFLKDPPFGKIDLVSCRNVLIYMEPYLQKKALTTFHYALNPKGFLLLGKSETSGGVPDLFTATDKFAKFYTRKDAPGRFMHVASSRNEESLYELNVNPKSISIQTDFQKAADDIMLSKYTPAGVVINEAMDIVHFRGNTSLYLEQAPGKPSHNLLKMAKTGLAFELRNLIHKAKKEHKAIIKDNIPIQVNGNQQIITIEAIPLIHIVEPHYLILFYESTSSLVIKPEHISKTSKLRADEKDLYIQQLEKEIAQSREDMRSITEDQEAANEELQTANEELLSGSEELQSLNEELETSKEELQSTNEEISVVNQELVSLNEQVLAARNYAESVIATIREPLLVLDKTLRVKSANAAFYKTFQVNEQETEGRLIYELGDYQWNIPALRTLLEEIIPRKALFTDFEVSQRFPGIGQRIMLLNAREITRESATEKLILLAIEDITEKVNARKKVDAQAVMVQNLLMTAPAFIATLTGPTHVYDLVNGQYQQLFGKRKIQGKPIMEALPELEGQGFDLLLDKVYKTGERYTGTDIPVIAARDENLEPELRYYNFIYQPMYDEHEKINAILVFGYEVTAQVLAKKKNLETQQKLEKDLEEKVTLRTLELNAANLALEGKNEELVKMNKELEAFTYVSSHDLQEPLRKIQTFAGRILEKENDNLSGSGKADFKRMQESANRMQQLIHDLLAFTRVNIAERVFKKMHLVVILNEVKKEYRELIEEKNAIIDAEELCDAEVIHFQIRQLMGNLIGNALKFSKPGQAPHIVIKSGIVKGHDLKVTYMSGQKALLPEKVYCHISIADDGIGFKPEYRERIFELFQRLHGKDEYPGTGIGLSIVKKIVDNHDGIITATSEAGKGARFDIYIPAVV